MFDQIISIENLLAAWRAFRAGKLGNNYVQQTWRYFEDVIFGLHDDLQTKQYRHSPYVRTPIQDPKPRIIHVSTVRDRIVHHALHRVLLPMFEPSFISDSYSCRIGRGTHAAVNRLETFVRTVSRNNTRVCWALKCDIAKYFNNVNHSILLALLQKKVRCPDTMWLIREIVTSFPPVDNFVERERERERVKEFRSEILPRSCLQMCI